MCSVKRSMPQPTTYKFIKKFQTWAIYIFVFNNKVTILRFQDPDPFKWKVDPDPNTVFWIHPSFGLKLTLCVYCRFSWPSCRRWRRTWRRRRSRENILPVLFIIPTWPAVTQHTWSLREFYFIVMHTAVSVNLWLLSVWW